MDLKVVFVDGTGLNLQSFNNIDGPPTLRDAPLILDGPPIRHFKFQNGTRAAAINLNHVAYMTYDLDA